MANQPDKNTREQQQACEAWLELKRKAYETGLIGDVRACGKAFHRLMELYAEERPAPDPTDEP